MNSNVKTTLFAVWLIVCPMLFGCAKDNLMITEKKCDRTVGYNGLKLENYFTQNGATLESIEYNEGELCKACHCLTGRVFVLEN